MIESPPNIIIGKLNREFILPISGLPYLDKLGGNLAYAAGGYAIWGQSAGLAAALGEDYPPHWLTQLETLGFDVRGIAIRPESMELRTFYGYSEDRAAEMDNPLAHFVRWQLTFPRSLLGYKSPDSISDSHISPDPRAIKQREIPPDYLDASRALVCPLDFISQSLIVNALRQGQVQTILLAASDSYMNPSFYNEVPSLFRVVGVLLVREKALRSLYNGRSNDLWEMAESIASHGCDSIIIFREEQGLLIYEKNHSGRWILPSYPSLAADPTGVYDSFAGGFFHGYQKAYRPEEGALYGSTSASLTIEGSGPLYPLGVLSGLAEARLESLRQALRKI